MEDATMFVWAPRAAPVEKGEMMKAKLETLGDSCDSITYAATLWPSGVGVTAPTARSAWKLLEAKAGCALEPADIETEILLGDI